MRTKEKVEYTTETRNRAREEEWQRKNGNNTSR